MVVGALQELDTQVFQDQPNAVRGRPLSGKIWYGSSKLVGSARSFLHIIRRLIKT